MADRYCSYLCKRLAVILRPPLLFDAEQHNPKSQRVDKGALRGDNDDADEHK